MIPAFAQVAHTLDASFLCSVVKSAGRQKGHVSVDKNPWRTWLSVALIAVTIIIAGWLLRLLWRGDWADEYYAIRELRSYYGDFSYLD